MKAHQLKLYNTLSRQKEDFAPINPPFVGMYVCGPTVYGDAHLGHGRPAITFDTVNRYLTHLGYRVRYVRNITDVGHLTGDSDDGEDKIAKKARLEQLEPMEIVQKYTVDFHTILDKFNFLPPSIEPTATGHIIEQIEIVKQIIENGYGYEANGSVYFDVDYSENGTVAINNESILNQTFNDRNSSKPINFDDLLISRHFNAVVYKEENVQGDRMIEKYKPNNAMDQLLEAERVKDKIRDFEHDLWNY